MINYSRQWLGWLSSLSIATVISRILGFGREVIFAMVFGASANFDGFITASRIPNMLRRLFAEGALTQSFVPVLTEIKIKENEHSTRAFQSAILSLLLLVTGTICLFFGIFPKQIISLYAWGLDASDPRLHVASTLLPIVGLFLPLISLISFYCSVLNTHKRFFVAGVLPAISNVVLIVVAWSLNGVSQGVYYLSWALVAGAVIQIMMVTFHARRLLKGVGFTSQIFHPGVARVFKMILAGMFGLSAVQLSLFLDGNLASFLPVGSMSWLYYAERLIYLPLGTIGVSLASICLPTLSESISKHNHQAAQRELQRSAHMIFLLGIPSAVGLFFLAKPIISILFERGEFLAKDVEMTALALQYFSFGLPFMMLMKIWVAAAYSFKRVDLTVRAAFIAIAVNLIVALSFMGSIQHCAISLAVSTSSLVQASYLYMRLTKVSGLRIIDFASLKFLFFPLVAMVFVVMGFESYYVHGMLHAGLWLSALIVSSVIVYFLTYFSIMRLNLVS